MDIRNYAQRVGKSSCVRCDFDTDESMSFADQDEAMRAHLEEKHPGWQTDGGASILKRRMPVSDADQIAALEQENTRLREALELCKPVIRRHGQDAHNDAMDAAITKAQGGGK